MHWHACCKKRFVPARWACQSCPHQDSTVKLFWICWKPMPCIMRVRSQQSCGDRTWYFRQHEVLHFFKKPAHHWCIPKCYEVGTCMDGMTGEQPQLPHLQVSPRQISTPGRNDQERVGDTDGNTTVQCECRSCIQTYSVLCDIVSAKIPPARDLRTLLWLEVRSPSRREAQMVKLNVAYQAPKKTPLSCFAEYGHSGPVWSCAMRLCSIELCSVRAGLHQPSTCWPGRCSIHPSNALNMILPSLLLSAEGESGPERDCWRISFEPPLRSISFILQVWKLGDVGDVLRDMLYLEVLSDYWWH